MQGLTVNGVHPVHRSGPSWPGHLGEGLVRVGREGVGPGRAAERPLGRPREGNSDEQRRGRGRREGHPEVGRLFGSIWVCWRVGKGEEDRGERGASDGRTSGETPQTRAPDQAPTGLPTKS